MRISRRDLLRRTAVGAAVSAAIGSPAQGSLRAAGRAAPGEGQRLRFPIRLDRNHNPHGPSGRVTAAMIEAVSAANDDAREIAEALRARIAVEHRVNPAHVIVGSGSGSILRMAVDAFAGPGKPVVTAAPTFELVGDHARHAGCELITVPLHPDGSHDLDAMLAASARAGLVYICNPNNPTGTLTRRRDLERFLQKLPASVPVVIDEAYHHYVDEASDYRSFLEDGAGGARIIVTRSFSKIHGLAGLRIGYAIASPGDAARIAGRQESAGIDVIAARGALTALNDTAYVEMSRMRNADDRQEFFNQANARMLRWLDSQTNFVMVYGSVAPGPVIAHLAANRIVVAGPFPPLDQYMRVAIGTPAQMQEFWRVWDLMPHQHH
jgi:histidinol-phosphate aminotransferase